MILKMASKVKIRAKMKLAISVANPTCQYCGMSVGKNRIVMMRALTKMHTKINVSKKPDVAQENIFFLHELSGGLGVR